jgi:single-strand DNA-binding protein
MASNETVLTLTGNLTDNPDLRFTQSGTAMCKFAVASTPRVFDKQSGQYKDGDPLFLSCTAWRELAENIAGSLAKGARVVVTGRLRLSRWETETGEKRSMMQLDVDDAGPSLRFATATVRKLTRATAPDEPAVDDPWASASPTRPAGNGGGGFDGEEPPF